MKIRLIALGKGKLENRSFGFQWLGHMKVFYSRFYFFGILVSFSGYDPAKDLEAGRAEELEVKAAQSFLKSLNRHNRRAFLAIAKKQQRRHA